MANNVPFGPNVKLPSIEGMTSTCEEELYVLMKEIDLAFERKHKELLFELESCKADRDAKQAQCEHLKSALRSKKQVNKQEFEEHIKQLLQDTEKLKHENASLKNTLEHNSSILNERDNQLTNLKNNLSIQKEENFYLKEKLAKLDTQHSILQENYKSLLHLLSGENKKDGRSEIKQNEGISTDFMDTFICQVNEKYDEKENVDCNELMSKINSEIGLLRNLIGTGTENT